MNGPSWDFSGAHQGPDLAQAAMTSAAANDPRTIANKKRGAKKGAKRRPNGKAPSSEYFNRMDLKLTLHVCDSVKEMLKGRS